MPSDNVRGIFKRLAVLALLCACLAVFASSAVTEPAYALQCVQDCWANEERCYENCQTACSSSDAQCQSCLDNCWWQADYCNRHSMWCSSGYDPYTGTCDVHFGWHDDPTDGLHQGYFQICEHSITHAPCVNCPPGETCADLPPC